MPFAAVKETEFLSPFVKKKQFTGDFKNQNFQLGSYIDFRVNDADSIRYTVSYPDTENGVLEIIVHLHGDGNGSEFMDNLKTGD